MFQGLWVRIPEPYTGWTFFREEFKKKKVFLKKNIISAHLQYLR